MGYTIVTSNPVGLIKAETWLPHFPLISGGIAQKKLEYFEVELFFFISLEVEEIVCLKQHPRGRR